MNTTSPLFSQSHIRHAFSLHAHEYDTHAQLQQSVLFNALRQLEPIFHTDMTLLDAGCGTGYLVDLLRHCDTAFTVLSCDAAIGMCQQTVERYNDTHDNLITCADITALPYADESCDMAVSSLTLQWVDNPKDALSELYRVLKPDGYALVTTFGPMTLQELREAFSAADDLPHVSDFPDSQTMQDIVRSVGFSLKNASTEFRTQNYSSVCDLMHAIRAIGATNKTHNRRKSFTGRGRFKAMEAAYSEAYETTRGVPASWEIIYLLLHKEG
ncbi:MAG: malonyl-ACP O-methyltransferase BioC [Alphaproteobacteria bacterium]|nr:malonyl-ACP O-methyltransferase BioC [Alphaproteobacteria bacterium]